MLGPGLYRAIPRSGVVEILVKPGAHVTYTTIQNWSSNVYNLVTKRAYVEAEGHMEWIDGNIGSRLTMMYPAIWLAGPKASGEVRSVAYAGVGQHHDTGAKFVHAAPETTSTIVSKSISKDGGRSTYRGLVRVHDDAPGCTSDVRCDALLLDDESRIDTYPQLDNRSKDARIGHEASCSKVADEQLFYLMSRGLSEQQAIGMIVNGFIEPVTRTLPMEYAVEWSRLIELQMQGSIGCILRARRALRILAFRRYVLRPSADFLAALRRAQLRADATGCHGPRRRIHTTKARLASPGLHSLVAIRPGRGLCP